MKQVVVLKEKIEYVNGRRVATVTTKTTTSKGDDMAELANYQGTLAAHQAQIERLEEQMPVDEVHARSFHDEIARLQGEMDILEKAIQIQTEHIRGYTNGVRTV